VCEVALRAALHLEAGPIPFEAMKLHEISAPFGLEAGLNYTLQKDYNGGQFSHMSLEENLSISN
jgi:hypothetical protein